MNKAHQTFKKKTFALLLVLGLGVTYMHSSLVPKYHKTMVVLRCLWSFSTHFNIPKNHGTPTLSQLISLSDGSHFTLQK